MPPHKKREAAEIPFEMARERDLYRWVLINASQSS
jgi:hypothetical protein